MTLALAGHELRLVLRRGESLLVTFVIPAGVLLVFSAFDPPAGSSVVVGAKTASVLLEEAVQLVILVGIAVAQLGFRAGPTASVPVLLAALVLGTVAFAGLGLLMAGTLRAEATLALANLLFLLCLVLGGIVLPLDRLPPAVAAMAAVLPPAVLTDALAIGLGTHAGDPTGPLLLLAAWAAVLAGLAARVFRWD